MRIHLTVGGLPVFVFLDNSSNCSGFDLHRIRSGDMFSGTGPGVAPALSVGNGRF